MKKFLIEKGLFNEYCVYFTESVLKKATEKNRRLGMKPIIPSVGYIPRISTKQRMKRNKKILELRDKGLSLSKIGAEVGITAESVRQVLINSKKNANPL